MRIRIMLLSALILIIVAIACSTVKADALILNANNPAQPNPIPSQSVPTMEATQPPFSDQVRISPTLTEAPPLSEKRVFDEFVNSIKNGNKKKVVGIYVDRKLALQVVYQPPNDAAFVSTIDGVVTYFLLPYTIAKNHGFLAHNYLAGELFFDLKPGDAVTVIWGDGSYDDFEVLEIRDFQALSPRSPRSDFIDLSTGEKLNANNLFIEIYKGDFHIALQTCIARNNDDSWGRHFVLAPPIN